MTIPSTLTSKEKQKDPIDSLTSQFAKSSLKGGFMSRKANIAFDSYDGIRPKSKERSWIEVSPTSTITVSRTYKRSMEILETNHQFLHNNPELPVSSKQLIADNSAIFFKAELLARPPILQERLERTAFSVVSTYKVGQQIFVKKSFRKFVERINSREDEAKKTLLFDSEFILKPVCIGPLDSLWFPFISNGDLELHIQPDYTSLTDQSLQFCLDIAHSLKAIHEANHVHRDLKPFNVLITKDMRARLIDFGFCQSVEEINAKFHRCGTLGYAPPEIGSYFPRKIPYKAMDIWSLGILLFIMATHNHPSIKMQDLTATDSDITEDVKYYLSKPENLEARAKKYLSFHGKVPERLNANWALFEIAKTCLTHAPSRRASIDTVISELLGLRQKFFNIERASY